jgi:hypothetical protein
MLIKKIKKIKEEKRRRHTCAWRKREWVKEKRQQKVTLMFFIGDRRGRRRRDMFVMTWEILVFLLEYFTNGFTNK